MPPLDELDDHLLRDFLTLFVTIDPAGTLSLFLGLTAGMTASRRRRTAVRAIVYSGLILLAFMVGGQMLLNGLGIRLATFQLTGGIVLFLFGLQMIFGSGAGEVKVGVEAEHDLAVFPLAMPSIASPGSIMAVVLLTDNYRFSFTHQAVTAGVLVVVLVITLAAMLLAEPIHRIIGDEGAGILVRVMGLVLAALATEQAIEAITVLVS
jgi:multiple antibiotic resistance protein